MNGDLCGALIGAGFALGGIFGETDPDGKKRFVVKYGKTFKRFEEKFGYVNCRDLKPAARSFECPCASKELLAARPCLIYVLECVDIVEECLRTEKFGEL